MTSLHCLRTFLSQKILVILSSSRFYLFPLLTNSQITRNPRDDIQLSFRSAAARGTCRVMCFSPKSNVTVPLMSQPEIKAVIDTWVAEMTTLGQKYK